MQVRFGLISPGGKLWSEEDLAAEGDQLGACLERLSPLYGQLEFYDEEEDEGTSITDDFHLMMFDLCIDAVPRLAAGDEVEVALAAHNEEVRFAPDGDTVEISGSAISEITVNKAALLAAMVDCGGRYVALCRADPGVDDARADGIAGALETARAAL